MQPPSQGGGLRIPAGAPVEKGPHPKMQPLPSFSSALHAESG